MQRIVQPSLLLLCLLACGCPAPRPTLVVYDPNPAVKIPAMQEAVRERDRSVIPHLIDDLASDDPAVRLFAITALERLTGERLGYEYYYNERERQPYVLRWQRWWAERQEP